MADLGDLAVNMAKKSEKILTAADNLVGHLAQAILEAIVVDTPIDTGRAKSNWIVKVGRASGDTREAFVPGKKGSTRAENVIATLEMGSQALAAYKHGSTVHITNNLDYINDLNDGTISRQAPPDYVQKAILEVLSGMEHTGFKILHNIETAP